MLVLKLPTSQTGSRFSPYILGGGGTEIWDYDESDATKAAGTKVEVNSHVAAKAGAGIDYFFSDRLALFIEGSYLMSEYKLKSHPGGSPLEGKLDTDVAMAGAGLKMRF